MPWWPSTDRGRSTAGWWASSSKRRHGQELIRYELPALEEILKDTYGVIVYQEQVMRIASTLANFTSGRCG